MQNVNDKEEELAPIDYKDLPTQTLNILQGIMNSGRAIYVGVNTLPDRVPVSFDDVEEILKEREEDKTSEDEDDNKKIITDENDEDEGDGSEEVAPDDEEIEETTTPSTTKKKKTTSKTATTPSSMPTTTTPSDTDTTPSDTDTTNENPATYTVSFMYNGGNFAEQYVTSGMAASKPKLQPSASGNWYYTTSDGSLAVFDFSTPISGNIMLTWQ